MARIDLLLPSEEVRDSEPGQILASRSRKKVSRKRGGAEFNIILIFIFRLT